MFSQTLRRLTALNSLVFLLIFAVFSSILYGYLAFRLFDKVDDAMRTQASSFRLTNERSPMQRRMSFDPRIFLLLRGEDGRVVSPSPFRSAEEISLMRSMAGNITPGELRTVEFEDHVYRVLCVPYRFEERRPANDSTFVIRDVIAIGIVDSEVSLLENVFLIIVAGLIFGTAAIVLAGYMLATRAMVPIQAAWEKQQRFVADASHELRSPVAGIHSNAELILRHPDHTVEEESSRISTILKESTRVSKLIAGLLTLARSDANQAELQVAPIEAGDVIDIVADYFRSLEEVREISFTVHKENDLALWADEERLHQMLVILLDNAFKYTPPGGRVDLSASKTDRQVTIAVSDTGIGIAPDHVPHVFDRFFRGDQARARDKGGTGLGLAIAQWIVEKHGGKIAVRSALGQGTVFTVTLPLRKNDERRLGLCQVL